MKALFKSIYEENITQFQKDAVNFLREKILTKINSKMKKMCEKFNEIEYEQMVGIQELDRLTSLPQFKKIEKEFLEHATKYYKEFIDKDAKAESVEQVLKDAKEPDVGFVWAMVDIIQSIFKIV
jgi:hypothetical protein